MPFLLTILILTMITYATQTTASPMEKLLKNSREFLKKSLSYKAESSNRQAKLQYSRSLPSERPPEFSPSRSLSSQRPLSHEKATTEEHADMKIIICDENNNIIECENAYYDFNKGAINKAIKERIYVTGPKNEIYNFVVNMLEKYTLQREIDIEGQLVETDLKDILIYTISGYYIKAYMLSLSIKAPQGYFPIALIPGPEGHETLFIVQIRKFENDDRFRRAQTLVLIKNLNWLELRRMNYFKKPKSETVSGEPSTIKEREKYATIMEPEELATMQEPEKLVTRKESNEAVTIEKSEKPIPMVKQEEAGPSTAEILAQLATLTIPK